MKHLIFLLALPLFAQQQTFSKITVTSSNASALITATQTGAGPSLALSGGSATMGGTTFLDASRNGTFANIAMSGNFTGTHGQNLGSADQPTFAGVNIDADFRLDSTVTNVLDIRDSGSSSRLSLNGSGAGGFGWYVAAPSLYAAPTNAASWALKAIGYASGTADIFVAESSGGTNYFTVSHTGNLSGSHIQNIGTGDTITVAGCTGCGSGVTSVSGTSPIASSGGATPAISCATCVTTAGGQSIAGTTTVSTLAATSAITLATTGNAIFQATGGALGDAYLYLRPNSAGYLWDIRAKGTSDVLQFNHSGTTLLSMNSSGGLTMASGGSSQIYVGTSGNLYLRTFSGTPNCSGVTDGWIGYDTGGDHLYICSGGTLYAH
jgi:hypothetical protein